MKAPKSIAVAAVCTLAVSGALLAGCSSSNSDQQIMDKLNQMETEISQLQAQQGADAQGSVATTDQSGAATTDPNAAANTQSAPAASSDFEASVVDLETRAISAVQTAAATSVPQAVADRPQAYFDATAPLEQLEREADQLEDQLEASYRQGTIDQNAFWGYDQRLNSVDNQLDSATEDLERRMGVDD